MPTKQGLPQRLTPARNTIGEDNMEKGHDGKSKDDDESLLTTDLVDLDLSTNIIPDYRFMTSNHFDNFSDGKFIGRSFLARFVIGRSFLARSQSFAIVVALSTVFHEVCQELPGCRPGRPWSSLSIAASQLWCYCCSSCYHGNGHPLASISRNCWYEC